ncbi:MAG: serine/threonine protein kinase, partial [Deltaproteobacteria bacterium]
MIEGIRLENYQLIEKIASKDIAEYYLAKELTPKGGGKTVVVKRIIPSLADIEEFIAMLVNEARLGMRLDHPNIVKIHHLGEFKNTVFLVQEYIHGHDLKKVIRRGRQARNPIPLEYSVKIISEVCLGLDYAHKQTSEDGHPLNIVHRNISPENILLTFNGEVKLQDFGVAKSADRQSDTIAAVPKGNISYLSPEQIKGETIDRRSDIFSTGIVLWELATGSRLFAMENQYETMRRIKECRVPSPRDLNPYVPAYLEKIVMKALSEKPEERYATAFEFHQALESFLETIPGSVTTRDIGRYLNRLFDAEVPDTDGGDSVIVKLPEELFPEEEDGQELDEEEVASLLSEARALSRQEDPDGIFLSTKKAGKAEVEEREIEFPTPSRPFFEEEEASLEDFGESEEDEALLPPMEQGRLSVPDLPRQEAAFESDRETGTATGEVPTLKIPVSARKGSAKGRGRPGTTPHSVKGAGERETHPATDGETTASVPTIPRHAAPPEAAAS